jgi:deoxyribodipyrimidine photo-lyase
LKRIIAQNNFFHLTQFDLNQSEVLFSPKYNSSHQKDFFKRRFNALSVIAPHLKWVESISDYEFDVVLAWDAHDEKKMFGKKLKSIQNRLFSTLPFKLPESFTPFRQLAEVQLPSLFNSATPPWDDEIKKELHYYFVEKKLPLTYLDTRNEMLGRDGSTKFSSFLSAGFLDVRYLYNQVRQFESVHSATKSTGWIIFELLWREFFYWHYQENSRSYFSKFGLKSLDFSPVQEYGIDEIKKMKADPFFHAAFNELVSTGYLSNRARQIFASIWINDLELDWRSGAKLFEDHLIDYDVYSNYGNWMYLAGVGVDPRGKRYFNVKKQLELYDPAGDYLRKWI